MSSSSTQQPPEMLILNLFDHLGGYLAAEDIDDFPWTDVGSDTHPGLVHHGLIGYVMQLAARAAGYGLVGMQMAREMEEKSVYQELMERWEPIAFSEQI